MPVSKKTKKNETNSSAFQDTAYKAICILASGYLILLSIFLLTHGMWFSPDQFFIAALLGALIMGRFIQFIRDWLSPLGLFLGYESLRSLVPNLINKAHITPMIRFDNFVFGSIPSVTLQSALFTPGIVHWYDYLAVLIYESHFIAFLLMGFILWIKKDKMFHEYFTALLLLSYAGFVTFIIFPAMPPWMASQKGYIPPIIDIAGKVSAGFPKAMSLPTIYQFFGANLVAAVPSLHAAYPWLTFLFAAGRSKKIGLILLPYVFGVWFSVIYLGEHYVFDIIIGIIYASAAFLIVRNFTRIQTFIKNFLHGLQPEKALLEAEN